jgi:hypothetical protein
MTSSLLSPLYTPPSHLQLICTTDPVTTERVCSPGGDKKPAVQFLPLNATAWLAPRGQPLNLSLSFSREVPDAQARAALTLPRGATLRNTYVAVPQRQYVFEVLPSGNGVFDVRASMPGGAQSATLRYSHRDSFPAPVLTAAKYVFISTPIDFVVSFGTPVIESPERIARALNITNAANVTAVYDAERGLLAVRCFPLGTGVLNVTLSAKSLYDYYGNGNDRMEAALLYQAPLSAVKAAQQVRGAPRGVRLFGPQWLISTPLLFGSLLLASPHLTLSLSPLSQFLTTLSPYERQAVAPVVAASVAASASAAVTTSVLGSAASAAASSASSATAGLFALLNFAQGFRYTANIQAKGLSEDLKSVCNSLGFLSLELDIMPFRRKPKPKPSTCPDSTRRRLLDQAEGHFDLKFYVLPSGGAGETRMLGRRAAAAVNPTAPSAVSSFSFFRGRKLLTTADGLTERSRLPFTDEIENRGRPVGDEELVVVREDECLNLKERRRSPSRTASRARSFAQRWTPGTA